MNLTLHLTESCNMNCVYCTREKQNVHMSEKVLDAACELAFSSGHTAGLCFFGGEPLLREDLIDRAVSLCAKLSQETGKPIVYKMTTNGTLLTPEFLRRAAALHMGLGLSFEGLAQDTCRHFADGRGSFCIVEEKASLLLHYLPTSHAMMTIAPQAVPQYAESVKYLYQLGFRRIASTLAYGKNVQWDDDTLQQLEPQLREISVFYQEKMLEGKPFFFSPFDSKIRDMLNGCNPAERCHLGLRQMPVAPDGKLYACTQFIGDEAYCLGDVFNGLDKEKCAAIAKKDAEPAECRDCALKHRCTHTCGCMNRLETGREDKVSPLQCSYEQMLIAIADETADALFEKNPEQFRKHYTQKGTAENA